MEVYVIALGAIIIFAFGVVLLIKKTRTSALVVEPPEEQTPKSYDMVVQLEQLPMDIKIEDSMLVEITDKALIGRITNIVPNMLPVLTNITNAVNTNQLLNAVKDSGTLYQALLPNGASLVNSRSMQGAFRGAFRDNNGLNGQVNLVPFETGLSKAGVAANVASSVFGVAALVVGQYYMTQIYSEVGALNDSISSVSCFLNNQYKSNIMMLTTKVKHIARFRAEILENDELRKAEFQNLLTLEDNCVQLLQQANFAISDITKIGNIEYSKYEEKVKESFEWCQFQQVLTEILYRIGELKHVLSLGVMSKEHSLSLFDECSAQAETKRAELSEWHTTKAATLSIDIDAQRRKKQAWEALIYKIPAIINSDLSYKAIDKNTAKMIHSQTSGTAIEYDAKRDADLYNQNVKLIVKDGKLYYFPTG